MAYKIEVSMLLKKLFIFWKIYFNEDIDPFRRRLIFNLSKKEKLFYSLKFGSRFVLSVNVRVLKIIKADNNSFFVFSWAMCILN